MRTRLPRTTVKAGADGHRVKPVAAEAPSLTAARGRWCAEVAGALAGEPNPANRSGIAVKALYTAEDWDHRRYMQSLGFPGQLPMTRGIYPTMYRGRAFSQRQLIGFGVPEDYARLKAILAHGASAVSLIP